MYYDPYKIYNDNIQRVRADVAFLFFKEMN